MDTYMISFPYGQCQTWITTANSPHACEMDPLDCKLQKTCTECQLVGPQCKLTKKFSIPFCNSIKLFHFQADGVIKDPTQVWVNAWLPRWKAQRIKVNAQKKDMKLGTMLENQVCINKIAKI